MEKLIIVLGMHRSGTSVLTGILNKMGLPLGDNLMKPTNDNPKGYFENMDFFRFNEMILSGCGGSWYNVNGLSTERMLNPKYRKILKSLITKYSTHSTFGLKDPRVCVLLPLYESVCEEMGIDIEYVMVTRNKESVINSIHKRDKLPKEHVSKLVDSYLKEPMEREHILKLEYESIIEKPEETINKIIDSLPYLQHNDEVYNFIDKNLRRN
jgi:hypothetical protein